MLRRLAAHCEARGLATVQSAEPTRGPWGMKLRESMAGARLPLAEELGLFIKDRQQHVRDLIAPSLQAGGVVLLDRYYFSTAAYQGARGADPPAVLAENERFAPVPDLVLLLDFDPAGGIGRIRARGDAPNSFEEVEQLRAVREIFLALRRECIRVVDASAAPEEVWARCRQEFDAVVRAECP